MPAGLFPGRDDFAGVAGEPFVLVAADDAIELRLTEVRPTPANAGAHLRADPFALTFQSDAADVLPQAIYALRNARLGTIEIFIVAIERNADGVVYEAVFT